MVLNEVKTLYAVYKVLSCMPINTVHEFLPEGNTRGSGNDMEKLMVNLITQIKSTKAISNMDEQLRYDGITCFTSHSCVMYSDFSSV